MANERREFTIDRGDGRGFERTVVGRTGIEHGPYAARKNKSGKYKKGRDGHFTGKEEGEYRRAIKGAVKANGG